MPTIYTKKQLTIYNKQLNQKQFKLKLSCVEENQAEKENQQLKELTQLQGGAFAYNGQSLQLRKNDPTTVK